jgi:hypothetical protein
MKEGLRKQRKYIFYQCNIEGLMGLSSQMIITLEKTDHQHFSIKSVLNV